VSELEDESRRAAAEGDRRTAMRLDSLANRIRALATRYRKVMRRKDPKLEEALKSVGYIETPL
jgi:hypothetical protein